MAGPALNYLVAKCEGFEPDTYMNNIDIRFDVHGKCSCLLVPIDRTYVQWNPSTDWAQGGPVIEREGISLSWVVSNYLYVTGCWSAHIPQTNGKLFYASTPLVAAMRCYVTSKLGDIVEVPEELLNVD